MSMRSHRATPADSDIDLSDGGFGLIEIIISMFLLALLAVGFLPLLIDALKVSVRNSTIATATQLVSEQLDSVTLLPRTCAALAQFETAGPVTLMDARGATYTARRDAATCPSGGYPVAVSVRVWATVDTDSAVLVESITTVIVERAN